MDEEVKKVMSEAYVIAYEGNQMENASELRQLTLIVLLSQLLVELRKRPAE